MEVDLGEVTSLSENQVHMSEAGKLAQGKTLVDEDEAKDQKYKLVLVGRKVNKDEVDFIGDTHTL